MIRFSTRRLAVFSLAWLLAALLPASAQPKDDAPDVGAKPSPTAPALSERSGVNALLDRPPSATDLILGIDQFNIFQTSAQETAGSRGDDAVKAYAVKQVEAAQARVNAVDAVVKEAKLDIVFSGASSPVRTGRLGGLTGATGPSYVKAYYAAQKAEYETAVSLLTRYLSKPDNDAVKAFAEKLLPVMEQGLREMEERGATVAR